jgi:hypothetical protein
MILSHLSQRIVDVTLNLQDNSHRIFPLRTLLRELKKWGNRPTYLIPMAYRWCSAISEKIGEHRRGELTSVDLPCLQRFLSKSLAIAFRRTDLIHVQSRVRLSHTNHHEWMLDDIFTRADDGEIADAVCVWIVDREATPYGSCTRRLLKLTGRGRPFSPRLRSTIVCAVRRLWDWELKAAELEFVRLLNDLEVSVDEMGNAKRIWVGLLIGVLCSPMGQERLSSHYWRLLGNLVSVNPSTRSHGDRQTEIMKSLEESQDWDKLETWMLVVWTCNYSPDPAPIQDIEWATLTLFRRRPSTILRFKDLYGKRKLFCFYHSPFNKYEGEFRRICDQVQAEQPRLESPS